MESPKRWTMQECTNVTVNLLRIASDITLPPLRQTGSAGSHAWDGWTMLSLAWMFVCIGYGQEPYAAQAAVGMVAVAVLALVAHKNARTQRTDIPSAYKGDSLLPGVEAVAKGFYEPLVLVLTGVLAGQFIAGLGVFLGLAGIGRCVVFHHDRAVLAIQIRRLKDARAYQRLLMSELEEEDP